MIPSPQSILLSPSQPNRSRQMTIHHRVWFCSRFLPVKRQFFLAIY